MLLVFVQRATLLVLAAHCGRHLPCAHSAAIIAYPPTGTYIRLAGCQWCSEHRGCRTDRTRTNHIHPHTASGSLQCEEGQPKLATQTRTKYLHGKKSLHDSISSGWIINKHELSSFSDVIPAEWPQCSRYSPSYASRPGASCAEQ